MNFTVMNAEHVGEPNFTLFTGPISIGQSRRRHTTLVGRQLRRLRNDVMSRARPRHCAVPEVWRVRRTTPSTPSESHAAAAYFANFYIIGR
jgi:hypothetical protein